MSQLARRRQLYGELANEIRISQNRTERFDSAVCDLLGINRTDNTAVDVIDRAGRITAGDLARGLGLTTGAVTALIDRLEKAGYLRRVRDPGDRRRVLVELTPLAKQAGQLIWGPIASEFQRIARRYSIEDLELILNFLRSGNALEETRLTRLAELAPEVDKLIRQSRADAAPEQGHTAR
jgi:DNA-binding MarR family transcriptional regulator